MAREGQDATGTGGDPEVSTGDWFTDDEAAPQKPPQAASQTHYTISENTIGASMRDKLSAIDTKSNISQPTNKVGPPPPRAPKHHELLLNAEARPRPVAPTGFGSQHQRQQRGPLSKPPPYAGNEDSPETEEQAASEHRPQNLANHWPEPTQHIESQVEIEAAATLTSTVSFPMEIHRGPSHPTAEDENIERASHENPDSNLTAPFHSSLLQQMMQHIQELEADNHKLRQDLIKRSAIITHQVFHCLADEGSDKDDSDYSDDEDAQNVYVSEPSWKIHNQEVTLKGRSPVPDPEGYAEKQNAAFIIYKRYSMNHQRSAINKAMRTKQPLPDPQPARQDVLLCSREMVEAVQALFAQHPTLRTDFPPVDKIRSIKAPYVWWYQCRKSNDIHNLPSRQAQLVVALTDWIEANYSSFYDQINDQFRRGRVSSASVECLIQPGDVLVSHDDDGMPMGHLATARPRLESVASNQTADNEQHKSKFQWVWSVSSHSYTYAGHFVRTEKTIALSFETETKDEEVEISSLNLVPLQYASKEVQERLARRGKMFWKCRNRQLVSYEGDSAKGKQAVCGLF